MLYSTKKGEELSNYVLKLFRHWNEAITNDLTPEEVELFKNISGKIIMNSNDLIERMYTNE